MSSGTVLSLPPESPVLAQKTKIYRSLLHLLHYVVQCRQQYKRRLSRNHPGRIPGGDTPSQQLLDWKAVDEEGVTTEGADAPQGFYLEDVDGETASSTRE